MLPVVGSKELVAWLPTQLGLGPGDQVAYPRLAYPTYEVGARLARAEPVVYDDPTELDPAGLQAALAQLARPTRPAGCCRKEELTRIVAWAREHGVLVFSDECYLELGWEADPVSVLHPDVCGGSYEGIVAVHSLSKRSNLAGYRAAFLAGDAAVLGELLQIRKHGGMMTPGAGAGGDRRGARRRRARRASSASATRPGAPPCATALEAHGFRIEHSEASLYLWATRDEPCWDTVAHLAELGILVAPGRLLRPGGRAVRTRGAHGDGRAGARRRSSAWA